MKTKCLSRIRSLSGVALMLVGLLLTCYSEIVNSRYERIHETDQLDNLAPADEDGDEEYVEKRNEFLERFFGTGPGGVSPNAYAAALDEARALPASPLLQGGTFVSPEAIAAGSVWTSPIPPPMQHSYGGNASARFSMLAIDPTNPNIVYAGSLGGLARTTDSGVTWQYLSDAWASQSVSSITLHPSASNIVYVGTGNDGYGPYGDGIYRSLDRGQTWSNLGSEEFRGTAIRGIAIGSQGRTGLTVYVANGLSHDSGLWRSSDSGATWTRKCKAGQSNSTEEYDGIHDVAVDLSTYPSTVYISDDDGVFKSVDSGESWVQVLSVSACMPHEGCARARLSIVKSALYVLAGVKENRKLYESINGGAQWIQIPTLCSGGDTCTRGDNIGFAVFAVDPFNPNIIVAGNQALYRTDNAGLTWDEIEPWYGINIHTDQRVIAFSQTAPGVAYDGNDGGVVKSTNDGLDWTNLNQNLPGALMYSVAVSADGSMIAGTQDNGTVYSRTGAPWHSFRNGDSAHDLIDPIGNTWAYMVGYTPNSFRRLNRVTGAREDISPHQFVLPEQLRGTESNEVRYEPCAFFPTFSMNLSQPSQLLAACQHVVRTSDATAPSPVWTAIGAALETGRNYVTAAYQAPSNSDVIYAVSRHAKVWVTTNANSGTSAIWSDVTRTLPGGISAITVHPTEPATAYLACNSGVYKTTNMGATWNRLGVHNLVYNDIAIDPANPEHIFAASNAGVFASIDGGYNWGNTGDGIPAGMKVTSLCFNAMSRLLAASTYGRGVYTVLLDGPPRPSPTARPQPTPRSRP
jgi:photosystem II stability/assembly factor-like uncharacterized protein